MTRRKEIPSFFSMCLRAMSIIGIIAIPLYWAAPALAENTTETETSSNLSADTNLSLAALLNLDLEVITASKKEEKISQAPGIITAYSQDDIKHLGVTNLADLADYTSGYSSYYIYGDRVLETRGQKAGSWNNNLHLLLVDGIPISYNRAFKVPVEEEMPIDWAQRVEFLKGPGSALYGTGAFYGVINLIPLNPTENGTTSHMNIEGGTSGYNSSGSGYMIHKTDAGTMRLVGNIFYKKESGDETQLSWLGPDSNKVNYDSATKKYTETYRSSKRHAYTLVDTTGHFIDWDQRRTAFFNAAYAFNNSALEGTNIGVMYLTRRDQIGAYWWAESNLGYSLTSQAFIPYVKYTKDVNDLLTVNGYVKLNDSWESGLYSNPPIAFEDYNSRALSGEVLAEAQLNFGEKFGNLIIGANYDCRKELGTSYFNHLNLDSLDKSSEVDWWKPSVLFNIVSGYAQYQNTLPVLAGLKMTAGLREDIGLNEVSNFQKLSPRVGLVQKINKNYSTKILYGTALRTPGIKEIGMNKEKKGYIDQYRQELLNKGYTLKQVAALDASKIPDISAEEIASLELGLNVTYPKVSFAVAGFANVTSHSLVSVNFMAKDPADSTKSITHLHFENSSREITGIGAEADMRWAPRPMFQVYLGASWAQALLNSKLSEATNMDSTQAGDVPVGKINAGFSIVSAHLEATPMVSYYLPYRLGGIPNDELNFTESHLLVNVSVIIPLIKNRLNITMKGRNLTNEIFYLPATTGSGAMVDINPKFSNPADGTKEEQVTINPQIKGISGSLALNINL